MELDQILGVIAEDEASHTTAGPSEERELASLEQRLSHPLPEAFRGFLSRAGSGIYFQRHEIFGNRRVMLHDIEFVPDLVSMGRVLGETVEIPPGCIPVHRAGDEVHVLELSEGPRCGRVVSLKDGREYPDFAAFLEAVVLPRAAG